jgi:hypothetical protein
MLQELDYVLWMSTDAGLTQPRNMNLILGDLEKGEIERRFRDWENLKSDLTSSALQVLRATTGADLVQAKYSFEDRLASFCSSTVRLNNDFLGNVLRLLQSIVLKTDRSLEEKPTRSPAKGKPVGRISSQDDSRSKKINTSIGNFDRLLVSRSAEWGCY